MQIAGYIASILIGLSLGLIGGGGSILTVPVLVYLFGINPVLATSYSLFIVGSTSLVGAYRNYTKGWVSVKTALLFGLSSITTVFLTRKLLVPKIPEHIATIGGLDISRATVTMVLFAILMVLASSSMIRSGSKQETVAATAPLNLLKLLLYGAGIGLMTGILGAGGGFLIIPTLVFIVKLPMKTAIGTSLLIIALNSLIGFTGDIGHYDMDWLFLLKIASIAIAGIFIGGQLGKSIPGNKLKVGFGWVVLTMGLWILIKEIFL